MRLLILVALLFVHGQSLASGSVLLLQGTSSSGKSSISVLLEPLLSEHQSMVLSIDDFLWAAAKLQAEQLGLFNERMNQIKSEKIIAEYKESLFVDSDQDFWFKVQHQLNLEARTQALAGNTVIMDTTLGILGDEDILDFKDLMQGVPVLIVSVYCPPEVLEHRTNIRNTNGQPKDYRDITDVLRQHDILYPDGQSRMTYDLRVETSSHSPEECALLIEQFFSTWKKYENPERETRRSDYNGSQFRH